MKTTSARPIVAPLLPLLLAGSRLVAGSDKDRVRVSHEGTTFLVDRYYDGRDIPYHVTFTDPFKSVYKFDAEGSVTDIKADGETYEVIYKSNGKLKKVKDTTTTDRRYLGAAEGGEIEGGGRGGADAADGDTLREAQGQEQEGPAPAERASDGHRRLYDCEDCEQTWDVLCDGGLTTVCNLEGYGSPLQPTAEMSIALFCDNFSSACAHFSASDVCDGECEEEEECLPPLTITLEWSAGVDSEQDLSGAVDLYVIEPSGAMVFWRNSQSAIGGLTTNGYSMTYTVLEGLDPTYPTSTTTGSTTTSTITPSNLTSGSGSSPCDMPGTGSEGVEVVDASGQYIAFAEWWKGDAPIYWTMTTTTGSGEVTVVDGQFTGDCASSSTSAESTTYGGDEYAHGVSKLVYLSLSPYVDNQCDVGSPSYA